MAAILFTLPLSFTACSDETEEPVDSRPLSALTDKAGINEVCNQVLAKIGADDRRGMATGYCVFDREGRCEEDVPACVADVEAELVADPLTCDFDGDHVTAVLTCDATVQEFVDCLEGALAPLDQLVGATCEDAAELADVLEPTVCTRLISECEIFGDGGVLRVIR